MSDVEERNRAMDERWVAHMTRDFNPQYRPESAPKPEYRLSNAAEYSAYQLGTIAKLLERLTVAAERIAAGYPAKP